MRAQTDDFIYLSFFFFLFFEFQPMFHQQIILLISRQTFLNSNLIPHRPYANVLVINNSKVQSLSNPTNELKDSDF
jgi:hypothetical protein